MKRYEYVKVKSNFTGTLIDGHREIIDEYALNGFRYVGYIPTMHSLNGAILEIDLIFEIDADKTKEEVDACWKVPEETDEIL